MSKTEHTENPKDLFSAYQQNTDKIFTSIRQAVPQYHQAITNMQQEYIHAYESITSSALALQKTYATKTGFATTVPEITVKTIQSATSELIKTATTQNQVALATIDAAQRNIKALNDNTKSFVDLNKNIFQSWVSLFTPKIK